MKYKFSDFPNQQPYDVCIVGSGPAGSILANELSVANARVCVLESGTNQRSEQSERLKQVLWEGLEIKEYSRERLIGGTSATWAGLSSPLDEIDFEPRPHLNGLGWPITRSTLEPFYRQASEKYRFPPYDNFSLDAWHHLQANACVNPVWPTLQEKIFLAQFEPQRFGTEFTQIYDGQNCDLVTGATVIRLDGDPVTAQAQIAIVRGENERSINVRARYFVLAANGIENARLLLLSKYHAPLGLGNAHDVVGRYFMNHPKNYFGWIALHRRLEKLPAYFGFLERGLAGYVGLRLNETLQKREGVLNSYVRFEPMYSWSTGPGVEALMYFVKNSRQLTKLFTRTRKERLTELRSYAETGDDDERSHGKRSLGKTTAQLYHILANLPEISKYLFYRLADHKGPKVRWVRIRNFMEMEPCSSNRVVLSDQLDDFGNPLPLVRANPTERDRRTMAILHQRFRDDMLKAGWGVARDTLEGDETPWPISADASHHLGTTRMGASPQTSVVNEDCRLHLCPNVYLAGGSIFSTSGNANPTYTVAAFSIRLARHLKRVMQSEKIMITESQTTRR